MTAAKLNRKPYRSESENRLTPSLKVKESNKLVRAFPVMNWQARKLLDISIAYLDLGSGESAGGIVSIIPKSAIYEFFGLNELSSESKFSYLKKKLESSLSNATFEILDKDNASNNGIGNVFINILYGNQGTPNVTVQLNLSLKEYLLALKSDYTSYALLDERNLTGSSIFLYPRIVSAYKQYESYVGTGKRTNDQLEQLKNPYYEMDSLKKIFNVGKKKIRTYDFLSRTVSKAAEEISIHTAYNIQIEKVKDGHKICGVIFHIKKSMSKLYGKSENFVKLNDMFEGDFTELPYTKILIKAGLIKALDVIDKKFKEALLKEVYPYYKGIESYGKGLESVDRHVNYVAKHTNEIINNGNVVKYLHISAEDFLTKLQRDQLLRE